MLSGLSPDEGRGLGTATKTANKERQSMKNDNQMMRRANGLARRWAWPLLTALALGGTQSARALVTLPFFDSFPSTYATGGSLGSVGGGSLNWTLGTPDTNIVVSVTNAQSYAGLQLPTSGSQGVLVQKISNENALAGVGVNFAGVTTNADGVTTNSLYASFLLNVLARPTLSARTVLSLSSGTTVPAGGNGDLAVVLTTTGNLALGRNSVATISAKTSALTVGTTYLVVARYNFIPGTGTTNDTVDLWLNPTNLGAADSSIPVATIPAYATTNLNVASLVSLFITKPASGSDPASWAVDEIRLGTNWASVTPSSVSTVSLPFYDSIPTNYTTGGTLGSSDVGEANWSLGYPDTNIVVTTTDAQTYSGLQAPSGGSLGVLVKPIDDENALAGVGVSFNPVSSNSLYASFLLKVNARPTLNARCVATLNHATTIPTGGNGDLAVGLTTAGGLVLGRTTVNTTSTNTAALTVGTTYLVVVRYNFISGLTNDTVDLWLNPSGFGAAEGSVPTPTIQGYSVSTVSDATNLTAFFVPKQASGSDPASWSLDEFRIATNWAAVMPAATGSVPVITSINVAGSAVTVNFTSADNSPAGNFTLQTCPALSAGTNSWTTDGSASVASTGTGTYTATTTASGGGTQFYRVGH